MWIPYFQSFSTWKKSQKITLLLHDDWVYLSIILEKTYRQSNRATNIIIIILLQNQVCPFHEDFTIKY